MKKFLLIQKYCYQYLIVLVVGILMSSVSAAQAPPNNNCSSATPIGVNCTPLTLQNFRDATNSYTLSTCGNLSSPDMYYSFTATKTDVLIKLSNFAGSLTAINMRIEVFTACPSAGGTVQRCGTTPLYVTGLTIGVSYRIRISTTLLTAPSGSTRTFDIAVCGL